MLCCCFVSWSLVARTPSSLCSSLSFGAQGTFLTASGATAKVWSGRTGALLRVYRNIVDKEITAICFDESLKKFIVGDSEGNVKVFNFLNGSEMCCFAPPHAREVCNVHYVTGAASVMTASWDGSVRIYDESGTNGGIGGPMAVGYGVGYGSDMGSDGVGWGQIRGVGWGSDRRLMGPDSQCK